MDDITVFLALASPLMRIRLRASLAAAPGILLVGEASTAVAAVEQLPECQPHILFTEQALLYEPPLIALLARRDTPHVVLVTLTDSALGTRSTVLRTSTMPYTLAPLQLVAQLRRILTSSAEPAPLPEVVPPELQQRFHVAGSFDTRVMSTQTTQPRPPRATQPPQGQRRTKSSRLEQLVVALQSVPQQRDSVTGLAGPAVLEQVRALIPTTQQAITFVGVAVQDERGAILATPPPNAALLRRLSATMQANVRREDLVCRTGPASFVVVLPGVDWEEATKPVERIHSALHASCQRQAVAAGAQLAVGVSYLEVGAGLMHRPDSS